MAVFGHSGSQAPQLMHSLVMTVATDGAIPSRRRGVQTASGPAGGSVIGDDGSTREEETLMRRLALVVATGLQAATHDYGGHRKQAIGDIDRALGQIRAGLATIEKKEQRVEHKVQRAEKKGARADKKVENLKAK